MFHSVETLVRQSLATLVKTMSDPLATWSQSVVMVSRSLYKTLLHRSENLLASQWRTKSNTLWNNTTAIKSLMPMIVSPLLAFVRITQFSSLGLLTVVIQTRGPQQRKTSSKTSTSRMSWTDKIHSTSTPLQNRDRRDQWPPEPRIWRFHSTNWSRAVVRAL